MSYFYFYQESNEELPLPLQKQILSINPSFIDDIPNKKVDITILIIYTKDPYLINTSLRIRNFKHANQKSKVILLIDSPRRPLFHFYLSHDVDYPIHVFQNYSRLTAEITSILAQSKDLLPHIKLNQFALDPNQKNISVSSQRISITPKEYKLLEFLLINKGKVIEKTDLLEKVWNYNPTVFTKTIETHFHSLNKKIKKNNLNLLHTVKGKGYLLDNITPL